MRALGGDLRHGLRLLARNPGFAALAVLVLALGTGASTAIFTVVNALLLKPLPYYQPERLVMVWESSPRSTDRNVVNPLNFLDWRDRNRVFERLAALSQWPVNLFGGGEPEQVPALSVTPEFFPILGVAPALGRTLRQEEGVLGAHRVAVLSHGLWQRRFGSDPRVLGQTLAVNHESYTIVGVMPPGFAFPNRKAELWVPFPLDRARLQRSGRFLSTVARLKPGVTLADARAEMRTLAARLEREHPDFNAKWSANVVPLEEQAVGEVRPALLVLQAAVGFLLLLACANVANLLLIRGAGRARELAVRAALGAGRWRIARQLLAESLLLATLGAALGLAVAYWGVGALLALVPESLPLPRMTEIRVDGGVFAFALALAIVTGLLFGTVPAFRAARVDLHAALKQSGHTGLGGGRRLRAVLAAGEIALAVLLLAGAGLMIRSFQLLQSVHPGFQAERVLTMSLTLSPARFRESEQRAAFLEQALERIRALPQVRAAGSIHFLPLSGWVSGTWMYPSERPAPPPGARPAGDVSLISPGYFQAMGIPLLRGRDFDVRDRRDSPPVVILTQTAARRFYPGEDPLGKRMVVYWDKPEVPYEVIGVAGDIRHNELRSEPVPAVYLANAQDPFVIANLMVRTAGDPLEMARAIRAEIRAVDKDQPLGEIRTMEQVVADSIARPRLQSVLLGVFAALALVLAAVGVYGVVSYSVSRRTQEIGVRMALGARRAGVLGLVLREGALLGLAGVACGIAAAMALTRYLAGQLYGIQPTDPLVFAAVPVGLLAVALAACYFPARRATRVDPVVALHYE